MTLLSAGTGLGIGFQSAGGVAKTYAEFQAHIATLAVDGAKAWDTAVSSVGSYRTTVAAATGDVGGSPWLSVFYRSSNNAVASLSRIVQHCFPSEAVFTAQSGKEVFIRVLSTTTGGVVGLTRNGYTSYTNPFVAARGTSDLFLFYDDVTGPMQMNPFAGTGPTPYVF